MIYSVQARPFPYVFHPAHTAVIMIDMQRDFMEPGGFGASLGNNVSLLQEAVPGALRLLAWARRHGLMIVHTREAHRADLGDCHPAKLRRGNPGLRIGDPGPMGRILINGEPGADYIDALRPQAGEIDLVKPGKGAFYATALQDQLNARSITHLLLGGVTTEVCVQTTMREANDRGYDCLLIEDATASYFPSFKTAMIEMVTAQGAIVGWSASVAALEQAQPGG